MNPELPRVEPSPEIPKQDFGIEYGINTGDNHESLSGLIDQNPQTGVGEQVNQAVSIASSAGGSLSTSDNSNSIGAISSDDSATTPITAADDDLIEKEWVDKVKKIIALTKDDPYEKNRVITQLQADYLKKRYNKVLGETRRV